MTGTLKTGAYPRYAVERSDHLSVLTELKERLRFDPLIATLSSRLIDLPPEQTILLSDECVSVEGYSEYARSDFYSRVPAEIELSSQPPESAIHHVSATVGTDLGQRLRGAGDVVSVEHSNPVASKSNNPTYNP